MRISAAIGLGVISITASVVLIAADGIGGGVRWTHHSAASAAPLLLVAGAIAAESIACPRRGRHGFMRLVAVLAFTAWGVAQLVPDAAFAGALNDVAILLFVIDAAVAVITDARTLRPRRRPPGPAAGGRPSAENRTGSSAAGHGAFSHVPVRGPVLHGLKRALRMRPGALGVEEVGLPRRGRSSIPKSPRPRWVLTLRWKVYEGNLSVQPRSHLGD